MLEQSTPLNNDWQGRRKLEEFFITSGFHDLLPLALEIVGSLECDQSERSRQSVKLTISTTSIRPLKTVLLGFGKFLRRSCTRPGETF